VDFGAGGIVVGEGFCAVVWVSDLRHTANTVVLPAGYAAGNS